MKNRNFKDSEAYPLSFKLAKNIFSLTKNFPKEERYSHTTPVVLSARSASADITERWAKRNYENVFRQHLLDASASLAETENSLILTNAYNYINSKLI